MRRVWVVFVVVISIFVALTQVQAKEEYNFKWHKVGDGLFELCELQYIYFIENVKDANEEKVSSISPEIKEKVDWKEIKMDVGLKKPTMKKWENGKFEDVYDRLAYVDYEYEKGKRLYLKAVIDSGRKYIFPEENTPTPTVYASRDREHFIFMDEEGIWKVLVPGIDYPDWGIKKLTKDTINGKSLEDIKITLSEGEYVIWVYIPYISPNGNYIGYTSDKDSKSRGQKDINEIWLIDVKRSTDEFLFCANYAKIFGWVDNETLVYSLNENSYYLYNVVTRENKFLASDLVILYVADNKIVYTKKSNLKQIFLYDVTNDKNEIFPLIPENTRIVSTLSYIHYSLSPDGSKLVVLLREKDSKTNQTVDALYMLDRQSNLTTPLKMPSDLEEGEKIYYLHKWISDNEFVLYTINSSKGGKTKTWIISIR